MAKAKKLPSGMWRCQPSLDGERASFIGYTKAEAEFLAAEWKIKKKKQNKIGMTIGEAGERYIAARSEVQSPKTIRENRFILCNLPSGVTNMPISEINQEQLQIWVNELSASLAPKTVKNRYGFVAAVIHCYAPDAMLKVDLPRVDGSDIYVPTNEEVAHLLSVLHGKDSDLEMATLVATSNGLRRSEICGLNNYLDNFKKRKLDIRQALVENDRGALVIKRPKTKNSKRILVAPQYVADRLQETPRDWEYIVKTYPHNITQRFEKQVRREFDHQFTFHDLRHYYASVLLAEGIPERYIMNLMGHSTPDMIRRVYGHIMADKEDEVSRQITCCFDKKFGQMHTKMHTSI